MEHRNKIAHNNKLAIMEVTEKEFHKTGKNMLTKKKAGFVNKTQWEFPTN